MNSHVTFGFVSHPCVVTEQEEHRHRHREKALFFSFLLCSADLRYPVALSRILHGWLMQVGILS